MITLPNKPIVIEESENRGVFEITACHPGYGLTIGNAIRRVLLSSLPGVAITEIKIDGVQHEFSTIPGVVEDVVQLMLNLKQIRFKLKTKYEEGQTFSASLSAKGEKKVTAGDIKLSPELEIINKNALIANLTEKKSKLDIEIEIGYGLGYLSTEERKDGKLAVGKIALDAIFSPVLKANYVVEDMRVGDKTNFERVKFSITTDGTITPRDAFLSAVKILADQYKVISSFETKKKAVKKEEKKKEEKEEKRPDKREGVKSMKISDLKISSRIISVLEENGIKTVAGLIRKNVDDLDEIEGLGKKGIVEIKRAVGKLGVILKKQDEARQKK